LKTKSRLIDLAGLFLKLGTVGFGGPTALIALMESEMVQKRGWVTRDYFMDMLAAINLVPGPNAVEMAIYLGYRRAGLPGLFLAGTCFLIPATLMTLVIAHYYLQFGSLPEVQIVLTALTPIIIAIILTSGYRIGRAALKNLQTLIIGFGCFIAALSGINTFVIILGAGFLGLSFYFLPHLDKSKSLFFGFSVDFLNHTYLIINERLLQLSLYFIKVGVTLFGGGFVLFAYIHNDMVSNYGWLSEKQLVDAIAVGQITPGPVSSAVTFIGFLIEGLPGAILSTIALFIPSFIIVFFLGKILPKIRKTPVAQSVLDGINAGVVALIFSVGLGLLINSSINLPSMAILLIGVFLLMKYKIDPALLILGGIGFGFAKILFHI
jgi:chromate transporter